MASALAKRTTRVTLECPLCLKRFRRIFDLETHASECGIETDNGDVNPNNKFETRTEQTDLTIQSETDAVPQIDMPPVPTKRPNQSSLEDVPLPLTRGNVGGVTQIPAAVTTSSTALPAKRTLNIRKPPFSSAASTVNTPPLLPPAPFLPHTARKQYHVRRVDGELSYSTRADGGGLTAKEIEQRAMMKAQSYRLLLSSGFPIKRRKKD